MISNLREIGHGLAGSLFKGPEPDQILVRRVDSIAVHLLYVRWRKGNVPHGRIIDRTWKEPGARLYASRGRADDSKGMAWGQ